MNCKLSWPNFFFVLASKQMPMNETPTTTTIMFKTTTAKTLMTATTTNTIKLIKKVMAKDQSEQTNDWVHAKTNNVACENAKSNNTEQSWSQLHQTRPSQQHMPLFKNTHHPAPHHCPSQTDTAPLGIKGCKSAMTHNGSDTNASGNPHATQKNSVF